MKFAGFSSERTRMLAIPESLITELFPAISSMGELKVLLYIFWFLGKMESNPPFVTFRQIGDDKELMAALAENPSMAATILKESLKACLDHQAILVAYPDNNELEEGFFFINNPKGRAAVQAVEKGKWNPANQQQPEIALDMQRPTIFQLYEQNIGPLTPMIAEDLTSAEELYPANWLEDAIRIAVQNNVRRWKYVESILKSWKEKGRDEADKRDRQQDRGKYIQGEYGDIIKH